MPQKNQRRPSAISHLTELIGRLTRSYRSTPPAPKDSTEDSTSRLKVYLFNVGQGDHILIELPNGEYGIIDFYYEGAVDLREPPALTFLDSVMSHDPAKRPTIAFICISHPDSDHIKGVDTFLRWVVENGIRVENFWVPAGNDFAKLYEQYSLALDRHARDEKEKYWVAADVKDRLKSVRDYLNGGAWEGHTESLQGAVRPLNTNLGGTQVVLIAPLMKHVGKYDDKVTLDLFRQIIASKTEDASKPGTGAKANLLSSILLMIYNKHRLLFGGDTDLDVWLDCLDEYEKSRRQKHFGPCKGNFIKVSHHGSKNSSSVELWSRILADNAYLGISAGKRWKHPDAQTLSEIRQAAKQIGASVEVVSTNTCTACLGGNGVAQEELEWLAAPRPSYKPQVARMIRQSRPGSLAPATHANALGAYIFRFGASDDHATLSKGMFATTQGHRRCVYENRSNHPFPFCAGVVDDNP